jgi:hypothetical protein
LHLLKEAQFFGTFHLQSIGHDLVSSRHEKPSSSVFGGSKLVSPNELNSCGKPAAKTRKARIKRQLIGHYISRLRGRGA